MDPIFGTQELILPVVALRLCLGFLAGGIIGFERASRHQPAGIRTHILIAVGSTLLMLLSIWMPEAFMEAKNGDPGRIAAQVVSGIGFLGAGSILRLGNNIKGLTTAASIWVVAALGLAIGAGMYLPAAIGLALCLGALMFLDPLEQRFFPAERIKHLIIQFTGEVDLQERIRKLLHLMGIRVQSVDVHKSLKDAETELKLLVRIPVETDINELYEGLKGLGSIDRIELKEKF
jgi:putative Mg2+ transporter-C (MgtC) family protein